MSWKFWKKKEEDEFAYISMDRNEIPLSTLIRWYCYDLDIEDPNQLVKKFDLMPVSDEGEEHEKRDSDARIELVEPLFPFLNMMANINSKAISSIMMDEVDGLLDIDEMAPDLMEGLYQQVSFAALIGAFSSAFALGIIQPTPGLVSMGEGVHEDE